MSIASQLDRWQKAALIDQATVDQILAYEKTKSSTRSRFALYGLGAFMILLGFLAIIGSNWDHIPAWSKLAAHIVLNTSIGFGIFFSLQKEKHKLKEILLFLFCGFALTFLALMGQIYQTGTPLWQALTLWLAFISPAVIYLTRSRVTPVFFILAAQATFFLFLFRDFFHVMENSFIPLTIYINALGLILLGQIIQKTTSEAKKIWAMPLISLGTLGLITLVSFNTLGLKSFNPAHPHLDFLTPSQIFFLLTAATIFFGLRQIKRLPTSGLLPDSFEFVSMLFITFIYFAPGFLHSILIAFLVFMAYWAYLNMIAHAIQSRSLAIMTMAVLCLRLIIGYVELFGSMLQTGLGMIFSGLLLIAFVAGAKKIAPHILPEKKNG